MKKLAILLFIFLSAGLSLRAQEVEVMKFEDLQPLLKAPAQGARVLNFWATWCRPCVHELPFFEAAHKAYADQGLEMILVSMDDREILESRVIPFLKKKDITARVVLLDETDYNAFINKIDPRWSGAIPATLVLAENERSFKEGELTEEELLTLIKPHVSNP